MITDAVHQVVGEAADVVSLMGPGVDPHLYKATQRDVQAMQEADIIFYNGLLLEGKMQHIFEKLAKEKVVVAVAGGLPSRLCARLLWMGMRYTIHTYGLISCFGRLVCAPLRRL